MNRSYLLDTEENKGFLKKQRESLLKFGHMFPSPGGGSYYLGDDGNPWKNRPRELWITCRMAHVYSMGLMLGHAGSDELADAALKGITGELQDNVNGGWYSGISADGNIMPGKACYAHAFVILAATSLKLAGRDGADELLNRALETYDKYFWNEEEGLSSDTWDTEFKNCDPYRGLNANMHSVEAFLAVADALTDDRSVIYRKRAGRIIDRVLTWARTNDYRIPEHYSTDWKPDLDMNKDRPDDPFKPYGATPGHGIEWARLIIQWATSIFGIDNEDGQKYITEAARLYDRAIEDAWDADGAPGIVYTTDWEGKPVVHDRMHWTLAEAINSSAVLYRVTGDERYSRDYSFFMEYLNESVIDHVNGSWFHQLDESNKLKETVWPGKSDIYHALQAMLIPYSAVELSIAAAIKDGRYTGGER